MLPEAERNSSCHQDARRLVVIGTSGAGKTTVAKRIASILDVPHIEFDAYRYGPNWTKTPDDVVRDRLSESLRAEAWVADGNYYRMARDVVWPRARTTASARSLLEPGTPARAEGRVWNQCARWELRLDMYHLMLVSPGVAGVAHRPLAGRRTVTSVPSGNGPSGRKPAGLAGTGERRRGRPPWEVSEGLLGPESPRSIITGALWRGKQAGCRGLREPENRGGGGGGGGGVTFVLPSLGGRPQARSSLRFPLPWPGVLLPVWAVGGRRLYGRRPPASLGPTDRLFPVCLASSPVGWNPGLAASKHHTRLEWQPEIPTII